MQQLFGMTDLSNFRRIFKVDEKQIIIKGSGRCHYIGNTGQPFGRDHRRTRRCERCYQPDGLHALQSAQ